MFTSSPLNWPYCLQMHNLPCIDCVWVNLLCELILLNGHDSRDEGFSRRKGVIIQLVWWRINVNLCLPCRGTRHHSLFTKDFNKNLRLSIWRWRGWCVNDLRPSPFTWLCVCVCLCLCHDCGERCDLTAEWCAAWCEDWEPINTLPFFTPHICLVLIVLLKSVWLSCGCRYECVVLHTISLNLFQAAV